MALDQPTCTLLCSHTVHTECVFRQFCIHDNFQVTRCPSCDNRIITQALVDEADAVHGNEGRTEIIQYMWHNEPQFKTGLEGLKQAVTQKAATYKALKKKEKEMVKNLEEAVEPFLDNIREKVKAAKLQYKASPEYKDHSN